MAAFFQRNWWPRTDQPARIRFLLAPPWPARIRIKAYLETRPVVVSRRPLPKYNHRPIVGRDANYSISRFSTTSSPFSLSLKSSSLKLVRVEVCANLSGNRGWVFEIDDSICQGIMRYSICNFLWSICIRICTRGFQGFGIHYFVRLASTVVSNTCNFKIIKIEGIFISNCSNDLTLLGWINDSKKSWNSWMLYFYSNLKIGLKIWDTCNFQSFEKIVE